MQTRTQGHQKLTVSKPAGRKFAKKIGYAARKIGMFIGAVLLTGALITLSAKTHAQTSSSTPSGKQVNAMVAAIGKKLPAGTYVSNISRPDTAASTMVVSRDELPANTYVAPRTDGGEKAKVEPGPDPKKLKYSNLPNIERLDYYIPSDLQINVEKGCFEINSHTVKNNVDGTILKAGEKSYLYYPSKEQWKTLGATGFDGKEQKFLVGNPKDGYKYIIINPKWNAIYEIDGPEMTNDSCGTIPSSTYEIKPHKNCKWTKDSYGSFLIATPEGVGGVVVGTEGRMSLLEKFKVTTIENPEFIDYAGKTIFKVSNSKSYFEIHRDTDGKITGEMNIVEVD